MQTKGLIGLLAVTVVAVIAAIALARGGGGIANDPLAGSRVLPDVHERIDAVARIAFVHGAARTTLVRKGDQWSVEEKGFYPADAAKLHQTVLGLAELALVEPKTRKAELYPRLEVEDADKPGAKSTLVTVSDDKGSLLGEIIAGKRKVDALGGGNDGIYVRKPGDAQSWLARGTLDIAGDTAQWLDKKLLDLPADQVKAVALSAADGGKLAFARAKAGDPFALAAPPPAGKKLKGDSALNDPAGALAGLELSDVRPAKDVEIPKDGAAQARFEAFDGLVLTVELFNRDGADWARIDASGTGDAAPRAAALEAKLQPWLFGLSTYKVKLLQTKLDDVLETPKGS
jgi:hypothetical protein